ncbi:MAG: hypothetical protein II794_01850, partial [Oscillospiraceae bacterium]|nr:hypothetical protein [Oscillospiraceae bacterium]
MRNAKKLISLVLTAVMLVSMTSLVLAESEVDHIDVSVKETSDPFIIPQLYPAPGEDATVSFNVKAKDAGNKTINGIEFTYSYLLDGKALTSEQEAFFSLDGKKLHVKAGAPAGTLTFIASYGDISASTDVILPRDESTPSAAYILYSGETVAKSWDESAVRVIYIPKPGAGEQTSVSLTGYMLDQYGNPISGGEWTDSGAAGITCRSGLVTVTSEAIASGQPVAHEFGGSGQYARALIAVTDITITWPSLTD